VGKVEESIFGLPSFWQMRLAVVVEEEAAAPLGIFLQEEVPLVASVAAPLVGAVLEEAGKLLFHSLRN
jgi:hypothetical protein